MQFANQALISANVPLEGYHPSGRLLRFIAVVVLTCFCLLHYFSGRVGRALNQVFAFVKVCLLLVVFFAGVARASHYFKADWNIQPNSSKSSSATAFLLVIFSFSGWENATFVRSQNDASGFSQLIIS